MAAPEGNDNAQKWDEKKALELFKKAVDLSNEKTDKDGYTYDFIGEVARELGTYHAIFKYLCNAYPKKFDELYNVLKYNLEANCFFNTKKGNIREATGIVNLKSNYKWTDRQDNTSGGENISIPIIKWVE